MNRLIACLCCAALFFSGCATGHHTIPGATVTKKKVASKKQSRPRTISFGGESRIRSNYFNR